MRVMSQLVLVTEMRFEETPDGAVWNSAVSAKTWEAYLGAYDELRIVARIRRVDRVDKTWNRADSERVSFVRIPTYTGPASFLTSARRIRRIIGAEIPNDASVLLRIPSTLATHVVSVLERRAQPFGVEVIGDPHDVFAPGAVQHPLRPLLRRYFRHQVRTLCKRAAGASYVTAGALQQRYPPRSDSVTASYSDVSLPPDAFVEHSRRYESVAGRRSLVTVSSLAQMYKATDVQIDAVAQLVRDGFDVELHIVGDGVYREQFERLAATFKVADRIHFHGQVPAGAAVREHLDRAELFMLPSRTEGLPRAMIEAMARGLPCIGSQVGGIPELLEPDEMVGPGDSEALAALLAGVISDPDRMTRMSDRNLRKARAFRESELRGRRLAFYRALAKASGVNAGRGCVESAAFG